MHIKLQKELNKIYPKFVDNVYIECGDGWYDILYSLIYQIKERLRKYKKCPIIATQVKEKFGTLRFYSQWLGSVPAACLQDINDLICAAMKASEKTCEICGSRGSLMCNQYGWFRTVCKEHSTQAIN